MSSWTRKMARSSGTSQSAVTNMSSCQAIDQRRASGRQPRVRAPQLVGIVHVNAAEMPLPPARLALGLEKGARAVAAPILDHDELDAAGGGAPAPTGQALTQHGLVVVGRDDDRQVWNELRHALAGLLTLPEADPARANACRCSAIGVWTPPGTRRPTLYKASRRSADARAPGGHSGAAISTVTSSKPARSRARRRAGGEKWLMCTRLSASVAR